MKLSQRRHVGRRYLAGLVIVVAVLFFITGTLGPAHRSPFYSLIVPPPALVAFALGLCAWFSQRRSTLHSAAALILLLTVLIFSHLLPRTMG